VSKILVTEPYLAVVPELSLLGAVVYSDAASVLLEVTSEARP